MPGQIQATWDGTDFAFDAVRTGTEHGYLRYVAFSSRSALNVGNGEENRV